jgi:hypothetical protein
MAELEKLASLLARRRAHPAKQIIPNQIALARRRWTDIRGAWAARRMSTMAATT